MQYSDVSSVTLFFFFYCHAVKIVASSKGFILDVDLPVAKKLIHSTRILLILATIERKQFFFEVQLYLVDRKSVV